jgi:hypothetical protein
MQPPKVLKKVAKEIKQYVEQYHPDVMMIEQIPQHLLDRWYDACGQHELFWTEADRYISDIYTELQYR